MSRFPKTSQSRPGELRLDGALDLYAADHVHDLLREVLAGPEPEVDLSAVTGCDAAGVQLLLSARATAAARQKPLRFISVPEPVAECCRRLGLAPIN